MQTNSNQSARTVIPGQRIRVTPQAATVAVPGPECFDDVTVDVVRNGERIEAINISCTCGRQLRLVCEYQQSQ